VHSSIAKHFLEEERQRENLVKEKTESRWVYNKLACFHLSDPCISLAFKESITRDDNRYMLFLSENNHFPWMINMAKKMYFHRYIRYVYIAYFIIMWVINTAFALKLAKSRWPQIE